MELKTPLYEKYEKYGGKVVPFAGYLLPVQYKTGIIKEHLAVRENAGLFDVSHMGEIFFEGKDALKNINYIFSNDFTTMNIGQVRYSVMLNEDGGIVDDFVVYKYNDEKYLAVVNAANKDKDFSWINKYTFGEVSVIDKSSSIAQLALQGPKSLEILKKIMKEDDIPQKYYTFIDNVSIAGLNCMISQTGYTGEHGFEIYIANEDVGKLWDILLEKGVDEGLIPCGLGARDTLRLEAGMPLYGNEMSEDITPFEAGLNFVVKMNKEDFVGKKALLDKKDPKVKRVGIEITGRGIAREGEQVFINDRLIGKTTSGTHCPYLKKAVAVAYIEKAYSDIGTKVQIEVRGRKIEGEVVSLPFYKR